VSSSARWGIVNDPVALGLQLERHRAGLVEATACVVLLCREPDPKPVIQWLAEQLNAPDNRHTDGAHDRHEQSGSVVSLDDESP
jgi:hypothetical protein